MQFKLRASPCLLSIPFLLAVLGCGGDGSSPDPGGGGEGGGAAGNGPSVEGLLLDDFEDGDAIPLVAGGWFRYDDNPDGGASTLTFTGATGLSIAMNGEGYASSKSLEVSYQFDQGSLSFSPYVGFGVSLASAAAPLDATGYTGVAYVYRGGAHRLQVQTTEVTDYDFFGIDVPASPSWKAVNLPFSMLRQEGWGASVSLDLTHVVELTFALRGSTGGSGTLAIDDLYLTTDEPERKPDLQIQDPAPPADELIDSIAIANPLQEKAMRYLNRGYNITNWLEQGKFSGFTYDESFVEKLAGAGFQSLRLPIDLDLYVTSTTGTGESLELEVDPQLFEVLDSFDEWTEAHGLSLTIDYHQYSTLPDKADADSVETAVRLWGIVAEHFADNPREDLFFELFNEPELSFDGIDPTHAEWGAIAERMIAAIRESDTTHTIIFGDTSWYGIDQLAVREPFADDNVIYAFHSYEPFIFTHQGASWAQMGTTHDLPYPYDPARWSEYSVDLGFSAAMPSWILNEARNYYRTGNRAALRNRVLKAKRWAVKHDMAVICNEFGAYDATSSLEDRARYYTDLISIFEELEIPWQHWFMVMDESGAVIPEYREAMRLGR